MKAELISVGTELLLGQIVDTNAAFVAGELPGLGVDCYFISQVGDNLERLVDTLRRAAGRSELVVMTGGLGPTEDDVTRESIAALCGETMVVQPDLEEALRNRFARLGRPMPFSNMKQATLIPSATAISNPIGTAPGWWVEWAGAGPDGPKTVFVAMPGVPTEMRRMWEHEVRPRLAARAGGMVIVSRTLKVLGLGESQAEDMIRPLLGSTNPTIGTYAKQDGVHLRLTAKAPDQGSANRVIDRMDADIRSILGRSVYGVDSDTPQIVVCRLLTSRGRTVGSAEYATGGALSAMLEETTSGSACYAGGLSASAKGGLAALVQGAGEMPDRGPVSEAGAAWMAGLARQRLGADLGLALCGALTGAAGEQRPVGTIFAALDDGIGPARTAAINYAAAISEMRRLGALTAINLLRLRLLEE